jgi:polysaccharide biosynthesis protein PelC
MKRKINLMNTDAKDRKKKGRMRNILYGALLSAALVLTGACASSPPEVYRDANMDIGSIYTVAVMPFVNLSRDQLASDRVRDVLTTMLLADGRMYVIPAGEVSRQVSLAGISNPYAPTNDEIIKIGKMLKAQGVITGTIREYGDVRSGAATANVISLSVQLTEVDTGKVVSSVGLTKGGIGIVERLFGGGGEPMNDVTAKAIKDVIKKLLD